MTAVCLLVEDDVVTRRIISNFLSSCSYEVIEASNGRIALEILESPQGDVVDIILTDNKMPEVTGLELIVRLVQTKRWQHLPVVIMSSEMREDVVQQAMAAGACGFLHKPVKRTEINALWKHAERTRKRQKVFHQGGVEAGQSAAAGRKVTLSVQQYEPGMSSLLRMPDQDPEPSTASSTAEGHGQSYPGPTSWPPLPMCTTASILGSCSQPMTGRQLLEIKPLNLETAASISSSTSLALRSLLPATALEGDRSLQIRSTPPLFGSSALFAQPQQMLCHASQAAAFQRLHTKEASTAHRQAAIARFRAKRTARSFEKRVRYANRQKLAVIRPRVKGQFCRAPSETPDGAKDAKEACTEAVVAA